MSSRVHIERRKNNDRRSGAERRSNFIPRADSPAGPYPGFTAPSFPDDEISLVDIWLVLWRHKRLIVTVVAAALVAGVALALVKPTKYRYAATVEIGTTLLDTGHGFETHLIDSPDTALAKVQQSFIPAVIQKYAAQHDLDANKFKLDATIPAKSQLLVISGKGTEEQGSAYRTIIAQVANDLVTDHEHIMQAERARYEAKLVRAKTVLERLQDPTNLKLQKLDVEQAIKQQQDKMDDVTARIAFLKTKYQRLDDSDRIIKAQIKQIEHELAANGASQHKALTSASNEATALTTLMVSNEVLQSRHRLADLQERLQVNQPNLRRQLLDQIDSLHREREVHHQKIAALRDKLKKIASDNQRDVAVQTQNVSELKSRIASLRETHALNKPMRSVNPVGIGRKVLVLLFGFLGVMLAVFAAFVAESIGNARRQMHISPRQLEPA